LQAISFLSLESTAWASLLFRRYNSISNQHTKCQQNFSWSLPTNVAAHSY